MTYSILLNDLSTHFYHAIMEDPLAFSMYSIAIKVLAFFLSYLIPPFPLLGSIFFLSSLTIEITIIKNWQLFKKKFMEHLDYQLNKAEMNIKQLINQAMQHMIKQGLYVASDHKMQFAKIILPWPFSLWRSNKNL